MSFHWKRTLIAVCTLGLAFAASGCGSDNGSVNPAYQATNPFAGNYGGTVALDGNRQGILNLQVNAAGQATGTLNVQQQQVQARQILIDPGVYNLIGTADPSTGQFRVTGTVPGIGDFVIEGTLPVGNQAGFFVLTIDGQTYSGTLQPGVANNNNNNPNQNTGRLVVGGSVPSFTFTAGAGYNGVNPPVTVDSRVGGFVQNESDELNTITLSLSETIIDQNQNPIIRGLAVAIQSPQTLTVGTTYPLRTSQSDEGSFIVLSETEGTTVTRGWAPDAQTTGSATLVRLTDSEVEIQFQFSDVGLNPEIDGNTAAGRFSASGTIIGTLGPASP